LFFSLTFHVRPVWKADGGGGGGVAFSLFVGESYRRETGNWVAVVVFCCYFFTFAVLVTT
jgi:hypothetical protein